MEAETKFLLLGCWLFSIPLVYQLAPLAAVVMAILLLIAVCVMSEPRGLR